MPAVTRTIESLIAEHGETLERCLELEGLAAMGPEEFIDDLDALSVVLVNSASLHDEGKELASAVTYLRDAFELDDGAPGKHVLLREADSHLTAVADLM